VLRWQSQTEAANKKIKKTKKLRQKQSERALAARVCCLGMRGRTSSVGYRQAVQPSSLTAPRFTAAPSAVPDTPLLSGPSPLNPASIRGAAGVPSCVPGCQDATSQNLAEL